MLKRSLKGLAQMAFRVLGERDTGLGDHRGVKKFLGSPKQDESFGGSVQACKRLEEWLRYAVQDGQHESSRVCNRLSRGDTNRGLASFVKMREEVSVTVIDNPFSPFEHAGRLLPAHLPPAWIACGPKARMLD